MSKGQLDAQHLENKPRKRRRTEALVSSTVCVEQLLRAAKLLTLSELKALVSRLQASAQELEDDALLAQVGEALPELDSDDELLAP